MERNTYYPEEILIEKMESGEYGWLDYVNPVSYTHLTLPTILLV